MSAKPNEKLQDTGSLYLQPLAIAMINASQTRLHARVMNIKES